MEENNKPRTTFLKALLYISFIGSSWNMFTGISNALSQPSIERVESFEKIFSQMVDREAETDLMIDMIIEYMNNLNDNIVNYGAVEFMLYAISVIGIYLMYRNRRVGFTIYMIVQILLLGTPILFGGYSPFSVSITIFYGFITMIFFALYSSQLKYMDS
jgi:hypothetical protein